MKGILFTFLFGWVLGDSTMAQSSDRKVISKDSVNISDLFKKKFPEQDTSKSLKSIYHRNKDKVSNAYSKAADTTKTKKYTLDNSDSTARNKIASGKVSSLPSLTIVNFPATVSPQWA
jgi:membrane-bound lytic murein transglycosylase